MAPIMGGELLAKCWHRRRAHYLCCSDVSYNPFSQAEGVTDKAGAAPPRGRRCHMADGWSRATGEPGVCMAGAGPGTANLLSGIITRSRGQSGGGITTVATAGHLPRARRRVPVR